MASLLTLLSNFKFKDGPTFVLGCDRDALKWLKDRFHALSESEQGNLFTIGENPPIESDGMCKLLVRSGDHNKLQRISNSEFAWSVTKENVLEIIDKLSAMLASGTPSHQYFDNGSGGHQTVVVTKDEYPIELLRTMRDKH